jgi:flagellar basal body rod protein FlgG
MEDSNVQPMLEMTRMMDGLRQFQFVSQMIQAEADRQIAMFEVILARYAAEAEAEEAQGRLL